MLMQQFWASVEKVPALGRQTTQGVQEGGALDTHSCPHYPNHAHLGEGVQADFSDTPFCDTLWCGLFIQNNWRAIIKHQRGSSWFTALLL